MVVVLVSKPIYEIRGRQGCEGLCFSETAEHKLNIAEAVKFCSRRKNGVLQSIPEAAIMCMEASTENLTKIASDANYYSPLPREIQKTRTTCLMYHTDNDNKMWIAVDHEPDPEKNMVLLHAEEGVRACAKAPHVFALPLEDKCVSALLVRAEKTGNIHEIPRNHLATSKAKQTVYFPNSKFSPLEWSGLELSVAGGTKSDYATNALINSLLGGFAPDYAEYLDSHGYQKSSLFCESFRAILHELDNFDPNYTIVCSAELDSNGISACLNQGCFGSFGHRGHIRAVISGALR